MLRCSCRESEAEMPLTKCSEIICEDHRVGIGFTMLNGAEQVVVWVDKGALLVMTDRSRGRTERAVFDEWRETLEAIASTNYDAGIIEPNGSTIIRRNDVEALD